MTFGIRFYEIGDPAVLRGETYEIGEPGVGEVIVKHSAVGLNFADTYFRRGVYSISLPSGIGVEAAGVITAVGPNTFGFAVGDRVTYTGSALGAYSTQRVMSVQPLIHLHPDIDFASAAASTMRGLTAAYLLRRIYPLNPGDTVLLHAAAGGVGLIFCQWARLLNIRVIGTVSTDHKAMIAQSHGCHETIVYTRENIVEQVRELTDGQGVKVVYDSIGAHMYGQSIDCLAKRGLLVCFGTAAGPIPPINVMDLAVKGSLFVTRPALADYIYDPIERAALAEELFSHIASGKITIDIRQKYSLEEAVQAHEDLESGRSIGSSVFIV